MFIERRVRFLDGLVLRTLVRLIYTDFLSMCKFSGARYFTGIHYR